MIEPIAKRELLENNALLLDAVDGGDYATYASLVHESVTAFEPEARGHRIAGLPFHRFFLEHRAAQQCGGARAGCGGAARRSEMSEPHVRLLGDTAIVSYVRLTQSSGGVVAAEETRVWRVVGGRWRNVHFHRSRTGGACHE